MIQVTVRVNDRPVAEIEIVRGEGEGTTPDTVCSYRYRINRTGEVPFKIGFVDHRYGDGALALVRRVCNAAEL